MAGNNSSRVTVNGPCLIRCGSYSQYKLIPLQKTEVSVGRNPGVDYCIASPVISRVHAVFQKTESQEWTITDQKSLNGIFINGLRIQSLKPIVLMEGMKVSFGMREEESDFTYTFCTNESEEVLTKRPKTETDLMLETSCLLPSCPVSNPRDDQILLKTILEEKKELETKLKQMKTSLSEKAAIESALRRELNEEKMMNNLIVQEMKEQTRCLNEELEPRNQNNLLDEYKKAISRLESERQSLHTRVVNIVHKLANQMTQGNSHLEHELELEKQHIENIIAAKELKQKLLEEKLKTVSILSENEKAESKERNAIAELMEMELQCVICSELFVEATTLNCSHSFCKKCISDWMRKASRAPTCPICRRKIKTQTHSTVLDSFIDRMTETFSEEMKNRRTELVKLRKKPKRYQRSLDTHCRGSSACNARRSFARLGQALTNPIEIADSD